jgi:proline iminopeptidase
MLEDIAFTVRFDQRGCGRSSGHGPFDLATTLSDMELLRRHHGFEKWIVGGHSWGANLALAYSLEHTDRVTGLIYMCGNGAQHDVDWRMEYHRALDEKGEQRPADTFPGNDEVNILLNRSWYDYIREPGFLRRVSDLALPALFIHAGRDIRPSWPARQLAGLIRNAVQVTVPEAGHYIWLSRPEETRSLMRVFISGIEWNRKDR